MGATEKLTHEQMRVLREAARPLWYALEDLAWVDGHGGAEFERIFPEMLDFIHREANPLVYEAM